MIRLILWFALALIVACAAVWLAEAPGEVTLQFRGWRVDTSAAALLGFVAVLAIVISATLFILRGVLVLPRNLRRVHRQRHYALGLQEATGALVALGRGDAAAARKLCARTQRHLPDTALPLLLSAQLARLEGDDAALRTKLEAMQHYSETKALANKGLSDYFARHEDTQTALSHAKAAMDAAPKDAEALKAAISLHLRQQEWQEAENCLNHARWRVPSASRKRLHGLIYLAQAEAAETTAAKASLAQMAVKKLPDHVPALAFTARALHANDDSKAAIKLLEKAWKSSPHPLLAQTLYTLLAAMPGGKRQEIKTRFAALPPQGEPVRWQCNHCPAKPEHWQLHCLECHTLDSIIPQLPYPHAA